jgi:hypothetical protein
VFRDRVAASSTVFLLKKGRRDEIGVFLRVADPFPAARGDPMSRIRFASALVAASLLVPSARAQALVVSVAQDVATPSGMVLQEELQRLDASGRAPELPIELLSLYVGDVDGDLMFDDAPTDLDEAHWTGDAGPGAFLLSTTANFTGPGGVQVLDGDVFQFTASGVQVVYSESFFQTATGTTTVDVDGFTISSSGDVYFSFADDEATTAPGLIVQNGGPTLDEQCVFRIASGASTATLHFTPAQAVGFFNHAYGGAATTVVDVQALEMDPEHAGEILMSSASTSAAFKGKVVSSFGGGTPFALNGVIIEPAAFDFAVPTSLDALALAGTPAPPLLRTSLQTASVNAPTLVTLTASGYQPGEAVQFAVSDAHLPRPTFTATTGTTGYAGTPLDVASPVFAASLTAPELSRTADGFGVATFSFVAQGLPPFIQAAVQTIGYGSLGVSTPLVLSLLP